MLTYAGNVAAGPVHSTADELKAYRKQQTVFPDFAPMTFYTPQFTRTPQGVERVLAAYPSSHALQMTGARPLLGRLFTPNEDKFFASKPNAPGINRIGHHLYSESLRNCFRPIVSRDPSRLLKIRVRVRWPAPFSDFATSVIGV